ncbi:hypothetical protein GOBAR_AA03033 [Gossypium barbadense]|uniref:Uncharacterized protein n=1 Tax=Gossypium barbadense TaxID=3634 RepID=A0A2P5YPS0_GOSBA|nr:hypothetical protein GOBAR_AA03033 [Gossypium barbadense]
MIARSFALANCVGVCDSSLASLNVIAGSFALANCVRGYSSSPASLNVIAGRFALINHVGGCDFSPASLDVTTGSFTFTNCVGGFCYSLASLSKTAGSFGLANCVEGCSSSPLSLNMTARSFALANCVGGCDSSLASFNVTTGSFALINCVEGCSFSLASLRTNLVIESVGALPEGATWPHDSFNHLHKRVVGSDTILSTAPTDHRVIAGAGIDQGSNDTSSGTNSISHKLSDVMDIDSLVSRARKKHKTTTGAMRIGFVSGEEGNKAQYEYHSKMRIDPIGVVATVVGASSPSNFPLTSLPSVLFTSSPIIIFMDTPTVFPLLYLSLEKRRSRVMDVCKKRMYFACF